MPKLESGGGHFIDCDQAQSLDQLTAIKARLAPSPSHNRMYRISFHQPGRNIGFAPTVALVMVGLAFFASDPVTAATQILLSGSIAQKCSIAVAASAEAAALMLDDGVQHVVIGTVLQDCNGRRGYTLEVFSTNCLAAPVGAKLLTAGSTQGIGYSVEARNPTNGGSASVVTGLLANTCTGQIARDVTHALIKDEISTLYINYTGIAGLDAGVYQDVVTVAITTK